MASYNKVLGVLLLLPTLLLAQTPEDRSAGKDRVAKVLSWCDSVKRTVYDVSLGGYFHDARLRKTALEALQSVPLGDVADSARLLYYAAFAYVHEEDLEVDTLRKLYHAALGCAQAAHDAPLIAKDCEALLHVEFEMQDPGRSEYYKNILQSIVDTTTNTEVLRDAYPALGGYYQGRSYYSTAQDYLMKGILNRRPLLSDTTHSTRTRSDYVRQCYTLAQLYLKTDMPGKALDMLHDGIRYIGKDYLYATHYNSLLVDIFCQLRQIDSALYLMQHAIDPATAHYHTGNELPIDVIIPNLAVARYYMQQHQYSKAYPYLVNTDTMTRRTPKPFEVYEVQRTMGKYWIGMGKPATALPLLNLALPVAATFSRENYVDILKDIARAQKETGNTAAALSAYDQYVRAADSLTKEKLSTTFADQETRYETNRKEQRIASLDKDNRLQMLELQNSRNIRVILIVGLVALGLIALLLYFFYRKLSITNEALGRANETKARLFGIISHDLRSPISRIVQLLQIQKERPDLLEPATRRRQEERIQVASEALLETMEDLLIWSKSQMQYFTPHASPVVLADLVEKETQLLDESITAKSMTVRQQLPAGLTRNTDENFLAIILRNLLQNAVKYGEPGSTIDVTATTSSITIINDARTADASSLNDRLNTREVNSTASGLGLQIARDLATSIDATISFSQQDNTLRATLSWTV